MRFCKWLRTQGVSGHPKTIGSILMGKVGSEDAERLDVRRRPDSQHHGPEILALYSLSWNVTAVKFLSRSLEPILIHLRSAIRISDDPEFIDHIQVGIGRLVSVEGAHPVSTNRLRAYKYIAPTIAAWSPFGAVLIDGYHRFASAWLAKRSEIPVVFLDRRASVSCLLGHSGHRQRLLANRASIATRQYEGMIRRSRE